MRPFFRLKYSKFNVIIFYVSVKMKENFYLADRNFLPLIQMFEMKSKDLKVNI